MLKFHPLLPEELDALRLNGTKLLALLPDTANPEQSLQAGNLLLTLFDGENAVGMLELQKEPVSGKPPCARIGFLVLLPEYRRHGLGRMLMALAASAAAERQLWFLAAVPPETDEGKAFAAAMHMKPTEWYDDLWLLDLSDVEGMRYGNGK